MYILYNMYTIQNVYNIQYVFLPSFLNCCIQVLYNIIYTKVICSLGSTEVYRMQYANLIIKLRAAKICSKLVQSCILLMIICDNIAAFSFSIIIELNFPLFSKCIT